MLLLALSTPAAQAQLAKRPMTIGGGVEIGFPIGEFNATWGRQIAGLSANFTVPLRRLPFDYGFDFAWGRMGGDSRSVLIQEEHLPEDGELRIRSNVYGYHGLLRLKPFNGKVSPYVEAMAGARHFVTRTVIRAEGMDEPYMEQRNQSELTSSLGWAAGVQIAPTRAFYVEARVERLNGGQVTYVDPRSIAIGDEGQVDYETLTSGTRVLNFQLGIGLRF